MRAVSAAPNFDILAMPPDNVTGSVWNIPGNVMGNVSTICRLYLAHNSLCPGNDFPEGRECRRDRQVGNGCLGGSAGMGWMGVRRFRE